jgi:hypothetical protein
MTFVRYALDPPSDAPLETASCCTTACDLHLNTAEFIQGPALWSRGNPGNHVMRHPVAHIESRAPYRPKERNSVYVCEVLYTVASLRVGGGGEIVPSSNFPSICNTMKLTTR